MFIALALSLIALSWPQAEPSPQAPTAPSVEPVAPVVVAEVPSGLQGLPNLTVTYYDVSGRNGPAIRRSMNGAPRPVDSNDGLTVDGKTTWNFRWTYPVRSTGECDLARAVVTYTLEVTLPRLTTYQQLSRQERQRWDRYMQVLTAHERNHADSAVRFAPAVTQAVQQAASCEAANAAGREALARLQALNVDYDRRTRHGATEGIRYP